MNITDLKFTPEELAVALDHELTQLQSTLDSYSTPTEAIHALLDWHTAVTVDPAVNGGYVLVHKDTLQNLQALNALLEKHNVPKLPVLTVPDRTPRSTEPNPFGGRWSLEE